MDKYIKEYESQADWRVKENSNTVYSGGGLKNLLAETAMAKHILNSLPNNLRKLHTEHLVHYHDLGNGNMVYCCGWSVKEILERGLGVDSRFPMSSPAKHFGTALEHILNHCFVSTQEAAGAMAYSSVDVFLAPFIKEDELTYKETKQLIQRLIFSLSQKYRTGLQSPFSNITLDLEPTGSMKSMNVIVGGKELDYTYSECHREIDMFNKAFCEVMSAGDSTGKPFSFPIPTYSLTKEFDWDSERAKNIFEMAVKTGIPYFSNYVNSDMNPEDARSMAVLGSEEVIYMEEDGRISRNEIRHLVSSYINKKTNYKMLMNGKFVDIIDMFKVPYENYTNYVSLDLSNGLTQKFSWQHKCLVLRDGDLQNVESQDLKTTDKFLLSDASFSETNIGDYRSGKILGYYLGEGCLRTSSDSQITFAININKLDIVSDIEEYFTPLGCEVKSIKCVDDNIYKVHVYGALSSGFVKNYIKGTKATTKGVSSNIFNTSKSFRNGLIDGLFTTDGCEKEHILMHTTNKKLCKDLIHICNSIGRHIKYRVNTKNTRYFKKDKSDLETFTSYELKFKTKSDKVNYKGDLYTLVDIAKINFLDASKINTVYNFTVDTDDHLYELPNGIITHQCCRLRLDKRELVNNGGGLFGAGEKTGSIGVVTLNLPRLAFIAQNRYNLKVILQTLKLPRKTQRELRKCKKDIRKRFLTLVEYCMIGAQEYLVIKRDLIERNLARGLFPYTKVYLDDFSNHFNTLGIIGMNEALLNMKYDKGIMSMNGKQFAEDTLDFMLDKLKDFQEAHSEYYTEKYGYSKGLLWNLEATPGEGTGYKLAKYDTEYFKGKNIVSNGRTDIDPFYTNSTWIPQDDPINKHLFDALDHQDSLQKKYTSGTVFHVYTQGLLTWQKGRDIIRKACENYEMPYYSLSPTITVCPLHGRLDKEYDYCPHEHTEEEIEYITKMGGVIKYIPQSGE